MTTSKIGGWILCAVRYILSFSIRIYFPTIFPSISAYNFNTFLWIKYWPVQIPTHSSKYFTTGKTAKVHEGQALLFFLCCCYCCCCCYWKLMILEDVSTGAESRFHVPSTGSIAQWTCSNVIRFTISPLNK